MLIYLHIKKIDEKYIPNLRIYILVLKSLSIDFKKK